MPKSVARPIQPNPDEFPEVMDKRQAAQYLQVHTRTLNRMLMDGQLIGARVGKRYRFHKSELEELVLRPAREAAAKREAAQPNKATPEMQPWEGSADAPAPRVNRPRGRPRKIAPEGAPLRKAPGSESREVRARQRRA